MAHACGSVGGGSRMTPSLSIWLDLCRVLAALAVYLGHSVVLNMAPPALSLTWHRSADDAVIAFFVISGLVIAHTTQNRQNQAGPYALARLSRVYSVAIPTVLFALAVDWVGMRWSTDFYTPDWQYNKLWLYLPLHWLFLGETWFGAVHPFTMAPYWSLGYEVWYYVLFGVFTFTRGAVRWLLAPMLMLLMGPRIVLLLPVWCLGVWLYSQLGRFTLGVWHARTLMLCATLAYLAYFLLGGRAATDEASRGLYALWNQIGPSPFYPGSTVHVLSDYVVGLLFALFVIGCARCEWTFSEPVTRWVRRLAGYTFTFYLVHFTLLVFAHAIGLAHPGWVLYGVVGLVVLVCTWLLAQVGEQRRDWYRGVILLLWTRSTQLFRRAKSRQRSADL